jgi:Tfp pilus assembly protein PilO
MFGPLNGVRTALVITAAVAAVLAGVFGQWIMTLMLLAGVAVHGAGWWYLYKRHQERQVTG